LPGRIAKNPLQATVIEDADLFAVHLLGISSYGEPTKMKEQKTTQIAHRIFTFFNKINNLNKLRNCPFLILICISAYEIAKIDLQVLFKIHHDYTSLFDNSWTLSSIFGSTIVGLLSDRCIGFSWRKPVVLIGMICALSTLLFFLGDSSLYHSPSAIKNSGSLSLVWFLFFIILNGLSGSYLGAARAFYLDNYQTSRLMLFIITIIFQCIPWAVLGLLLSLEIVSPLMLHFIAIAAMLLSFVAILSFVNDHRKPQFESKHPIIELKEVYRKYNHVLYWSILISFFILALSYQLMPYFGEYYFTESQAFSLMFLLGLGVAMGAAVALFVQTSTIKALKMGYFLSCLLFFSYAFLKWMAFSKSNQYFEQFFQYAIFGGFLWPMSIREFLLKSKFTEDGFILGFIESIQSLAEFLGAWLTSETFIKKEINPTLFFLLLLIAFILVSLDSIKRFMGKNNHQT
jgi:hypothetical protein